MKKKPLNKTFKTKSNEQLFQYLIDSLQNTINGWDWFINFSKVKQNFDEVEADLNLLNVLIGKKDIQKELSKLMIKYPSVIKTIPLLIALRNNQFTVLTNKKSLKTKTYNFNKPKLTNIEAKEYAKIFTETGLGELLSDKTIKSIPDYLIGIEVGFETNARKNRSGKSMEDLVDEYLKKLSKKINFSYLSQATKSKIKEELGLDIEFDKSNRIVDFAINYKNKLYIIEVNFYGGGGSKLKSTATEYIEMSKRYKSQNVKFAWITDGKGWETTKAPLEEFFNSSDYLFNIHMMQKGALEYFLKNA